MPATTAPTNLLGEPCLGSGEPAFDEWSAVGAGRLTFLDAPPAEILTGLVREAGLRGDVVVIDGAAPDGGGRTVRLPATAALVVVVGVADRFLADDDEARAGRAYHERLTALVALAHERGVAVVVTNRADRTRSRAAFAAVTQALAAECVAFGRDGGTVTARFLKRGVTVRFRAAQTLAPALATSVAPAVASA